MQSGFNSRGTLDSIPGKMSALVGVCTAPERMMQKKAANRFKAVKSSLPMLALLWVNRADFFFS